MRTGVTAILPRGRDEHRRRRCSARWFSLNGNGEMTGTAWIDESGQLEGPVMLTNTHSVGVVRDAVIAWRVQARRRGCQRLLVVVAGRRRNLGRRPQRHQRLPREARARRAGAARCDRGGPVAEGNVGGGTGMICHEFKCGIGTASRRVTR